MTTSTLIRALGISYRSLRSATSNRCEQGTMSLFPYSTTTTTTTATTTTTYLATEAAEINQEMKEIFGTPLESTDENNGPSFSRQGNARQHNIISQNAPRLTHADESGKATMVNVGTKSNTARTACASARVLLGPTAFSLAAENQIAKGDVLTVAQLAGTMGAKHTSTLIPLCHPLLLSHVDVRLELNREYQSIDIKATACTTGPTGVEMEAMTAVAVSALTVYDMCKAASKEIEITELKLLMKTGGKSGTWERST